MNAENAILNRRSVRKFKDYPVPRELIDKLLCAADSAPSACNRRPVDFYVITDKDRLSSLEGAGRFTAIHSPLAIVVVGNMKRTLPRSFADYWIHDAAAASENILIMATALGLGSCWCGVHLQKSVMDNLRGILGLDEDGMPFSIIRIGYPEVQTEPHEGYCPDRVHFID